MRVRKVLELLSGTAIICALVQMPAARGADNQGSNDAIIIENFDDTPVGEFPERWDYKDDDDKDKNNPYTVREENGNRYLHADDTGQSVIIGRDFRWRLKEYPILTWRWRAQVLPPNGDERGGDHGSNDSAGGFYVVMDRNFFRIPKTIKYVWSTTLPAGTITRRDKIARPWVIVLRSGDAQLGKWMTEEVDLIEGWKNTHGGGVPDRPISIGLLTDANSSGARAVCDYDDIMLLKKPRNKATPLPGQ